LVVSAVAASQVTIDEVFPAANQKHRTCQLLSEMTESASLMKHPLHNRALLRLLIATLLWAVSFPFVQILYIEQRALVPGATTFFLSILLMASRFGMATLLLLPWVLPHIKTYTAREWQQGL
jgi:hypothetical protein